MLFYAPYSTNTCSVSNDYELGTPETHVSKTDVVLILLADTISLHSLPLHYHFLETWASTTYVCTHVSKGACTSKQVCTGRCPPCCMRQSLTDLQLSRKLGWLASNPQGPAHLCLHSNRITGVCQHGYRDRSSWLRSRL